MLKSCDDCGYHKEYCPDERELHICENANVKEKTIADLNKAEECPEYDDDSWMK